MTLASELKDFVMKGDVIDLAVAVIIGVAFNAVVTAFVSDIITPLIGIPGHVNFSAYSYTINGSVFMVGSFVSALISFLTIAVVVFLFIVKPVSKIKENSDKKSKERQSSHKAVPGMPIPDTIGGEAMRLLHIKG